MSKLAIKGGTPIRKTLFPAQNTIGQDEKDAVMRVMSGHAVLTGYQGNFGQAFRGGVEIRALEEEWAAKFGVKHAIACNSATSGLYIACGAVGMDRTGAGDAIVSPFSMTCSASIPLAWRQGVRFADIERDYYCISHKSVKAHLRGTFNKYSAVIAVSLFGQAYDRDNINQMLALNFEETGKRTYVIEDAAQAVGAKLNGKYAGTLGDIGIYSFNLGKHLTCGEGGMMVTDDDELAMRCRLIMNHAEAVVNDMPAEMQGKYRGLFGMNLRMSEIHAAIVREQLKRMDEFVAWRVDNVNYLVNKLKSIPCLEMPKVREGATHSYYVLPLKYNFPEKEYYADCDSSKPIVERNKIHRDKFIAAVKAELKPVAGREHEGVTIGYGYIRPIQSMPLFDRALDETPECKRQWQDELIVLHRFFGPAASKQDLDDVADAFAKVWENREELL